VILEAINTYSEINMTKNYPSRFDTALNEWAVEVDTSIEILQAIMVMANGNRWLAERIFSSPTDCERERVGVLAFEIQYTDFPDPEYQDTCLYWDGEKVFYGG
jgi:hypothetical protein